MNVIEVQNLVKRFGDKTVVDNVSMIVTQGEISGFLGPNGSGKTTTIRVMCGLLTPDGGSGHVLGHDIRTDSGTIKREVGYMTQRFSFYEDLSIEENLTFVARLYQLEPVRGHVRDTLDRSGPDLATAAAGRAAVGRLEAAAGAGRLPHARAQAAAARRTDRRRRPQGAARVLGRDPRAGGGGSDGAGLDPLHGRGRALPPDQLHLLRQADGQRHGGGGRRKRRADDLRDGGGQHQRRSQGACGDARRRSGRALRH